MIGAVVIKYSSNHNYEDEVMRIKIHKDKICNKILCQQWNKYNVIDN